MIIGADEAQRSGHHRPLGLTLCSYGLRRVYYSAFSPIPSTSQNLPLRRPPLMREHRLYQADWLMRYYGFAPEEIVDGASDGMLDLERDPKLAGLCAIGLSFRSTSTALRAKRSCACRA